MKLNNILFFLITVAFLSCKNTENQSQKKASKITFETIAQEKLSKSFKKLFNASGSHVICYTQHKTTQSNPVAQIHFLVFEVQSHRLIYENTANQATIQWLTDKRFKVQTLKKNAELKANYYVYDVEKQRKVQVDTDL